MDILTPPDGTGPGVLVAHPRWGLNRTIRDYGAALAREGFVVGLPDLFAGDVTTSIETAETLIRKHWDTAPGLLTNALAELSRYTAMTGSTIGAVGFSFGGFHLLSLLDQTQLPLGGARRLLRDLRPAEDARPGACTSGAGRPP